MLVGGTNRERDLKSGQSTSCRRVHVDYGRAPASFAKRSINANVVTPSSEPEFMSTARCG